MINALHLLIGFVLLEAVGACFKDKSRKICGEGLDYKTMQPSPQ
jgi:hypothetical protein